MADIPDPPAALPLVQAQFPTTPGGDRVSDPYAPVGSIGDYDGPNFPHYVEIPPPELPPRQPYHSDGIDWGDPINGILAGALLFGGLGIVGVLVLVVVVITGG